MRVAVLGATGQTGQEAVAQALKEGHTVTAIVRNPDKMKLQDPNLKVVQGDVFSESSLTAVLPEHDAVVSCLGFARKPKPVTGYSESIKAIAGAMRTANVRRLVTMTSWYTDTSTAAKGGFIINWILVPLIKPVLTNMYQMEEHLRDHCGDLDYTVVRPPGLGSGPLTAKPIKTEENFLVEGSTSGRMPRSDVARFMLSVLGGDTFSKKMVAIAT